MPRVVVHTDWETLAPIRAAWQSWSGPRFMSDGTWLQAWWQALASSRAAPHPLARGGRWQLAVMAVYGESDNLLGIAPFYIAQGLVHRSLRMLGDGVAASDYVGIVAAPGRAGECGEAVADYLATEEFRERFGAIDSIQWEGQAADGEGLTSFWARLAEHGWRHERWEIEGAWRLALPDAWETYLSWLGASHRRKVRKMIKWRDSHQVRVETATELTALERVWPVFIALHQQRRRGLGQSGCFADPLFERFLKLATSELIKSGHARLSLSWVGPSPIAAGLYFERSGTLSIYQCGFDDRFQQYEPGHFLNAVAVYDAIAKGLSIYDFLRGDEPYKQFWRAQRVPLYRWRGVSPHWQARLKHSAWRVLRKVKRTGLAVVSAFQQSVKQHVSNSNHPVP